MGLEVGTLQDFLQCRQVNQWQETIDRIINQIDKKRLRISNTFFPGEWDDVGTMYTEELRCESISTFYHAWVPWKELKEKPKIIRNGMLYNIAMHLGKITVQLSPRELGYRAEKVIISTRFLITLEIIGRSAHLRFYSFNTRLVKSIPADNIFSVSGNYMMAVKTHETKGEYLYVEGNRHHYYIYLHQGELEPKEDEPPLNKPKSQARAASVFVVTNHRQTLIIKVDTFDFEEKLIIFNINRQTFGGSCNITDCTYTCRLFVLATDSGITNLYRVQNLLDLTGLDLSKPDYHHRHIRGLRVVSLHVSRYNDEEQCVHLVINYGEEVAILKIST